MLLGVKIQVCLIQCEAPTSYILHYNLYLNLQNITALLVVEIMIKKKDS
jgi:hypothetical protein